MELRLPWTISTFLFKDELGDEMDDERCDDFRVTISTVDSSMGGKEGKKRDLVLDFAIFLNNEMILLLEQKKSKNTKTFFLIYKNTT